ncbi:MAG: permease, partial [Ignavibacteria bacterium]|nr:permease [Ignavibacteria bacterium]
VVSIIRSFFPPEKTKKFLSKAKFPILNNFLAALIGIVTPFCSCSAVPLFIGLVEAGVPLGVTFSFLVSAPMVNEVALVLLWGLFGWKIALIYIVSGVLIATVAGWVLGKLKLEKWVEEFVHKIKSSEVAEKKLTAKDRIDYAKRYTIDIVKSVWIYILIGVGLGALMHGYAPNDLLVQYAGPSNLFAVPLAVLIGIPLYSNAAGTIPIVSVLIDKGMAMGTALAFMMAVTALSLPEFIILRKVLKPKLITIYASIVGLGIIFTGYLFNMVIR